MKQLSFALAFILGTLVFMNAKIVSDNSVMTDISGKVVSEPEEKIVNSDEVIEIQKSSITECCKFIGENGREKSCFALRSFSCDYCNNVC